MANFQWKGIISDPGDLERALVAARVAAGVSSPTATECQALLSGEQPRSGSLGWGQDPVAGRGFGRVTCVWWTDHLGRRHWFVEGDKYRLEGEPNPFWRCRDGLPSHPLWVLASRSVAVRGDGAEATVLLVCDCGVVGTPETIAWMGDCCGPCFDLRLEGNESHPPLAIHPHRSGVVGLGFTQDGRVFSCGWRDDSPCLSDRTRGQEILFDPPTTGGAVGAAMLPGDRAVVAYHDKMAACWDLMSEEEVWRSRCYGELMGVEASPLGDLVVVDGVSVPTLLDAETGDVRLGPDNLSNFAFSPDGDTVYAYDCESRTVVAMDAITEEVGDTGLEFGEPEEDDCYSLRCCPTRPLLVSGGDDGRLRFGDLVAGRWLRVNDGPTGLVSSLAFSPDGRTLVSGHDDRVVFWDVDAMTVRTTLRVPGYGVAALTFSPDGETLAVGDAQGVIRLWPWRRMIDS